MASNLPIKADKEGAVQVVWTIVIAGLIGGAIYGIYYFFFRTDVNKDLERLKSQGVLPTFSDSQAQGYADSLNDLLNAMFIDQGAVFTIFNRCVNLADVLFIISKFGTRFYFNLSTVGEYTLPEYMRHRLSSSDLDVINSGLNAKSINYRF